MSGRCSLTLPYRYAISKFTECHKLTEPVLSRFNRSDNDREKDMEEERDNDDAIDIESKCVGSDLENWLEAVEFR